MALNYYQKILGLFAPKVNKLGQELIAEPFPVLGKLQRTTPLHYLKNDYKWLVLGYQECNEVFLNPTKFSSTIFREGVGETMIAFDPPKHGSSRSLFNPSFSKEKAGNYATSIEEAAERIVLELLSKPTFDSYEQLAVPYAHAAAGPYLGIRPELAAELVERAFGMKQDKTFKVSQLKPYLFDDGLFSQLIINNEKYSEQEKLDNSFFFVIAGLQSIVQALANTLFVISQNQSTWKAIWDDPKVGMKVSQEALRLQPVVHSLPRITTQDVFLANKKIPKGSSMDVCMMVANRDPKVFANPHEFNPNRAGSAPLVYGAGIHKCLGMHLANQIVSKLVEVMAANHITVKTSRGAAPQFHGALPFVRGVSAHQISLVRH